jgi:hypothetical protein
LTTVGKEGTGMKKKKKKKEHSLVSRCAVQITRQSIGTEDFGAHSENLVLHHIWLLFVKECLSGYKLLDRPPWKA